MIGSRSKIIATVALVVGLVWCSTPAQAHNYLVSSTPEADAILTELPEEFTITTNDVLLDLGGQGNGFALQVRDANGRYYGDGCVTVDGQSMSAVPALGEAGDYTVQWQVVSTDGHPVSDEFAFTWAPTDAAEPAVGAESAPVCGSEPQNVPAPGGTDTDRAETGSAEGAAPSDAGVDPAASAPADGWWIGGAAAAAGLAAGVALLVRRRGGTR